MDQHVLNRLFQKYLDKTASPEEVEQLLLHFAPDTEDIDLRNMIISEMQKDRIPDNVISLKDEAIFLRVKTNLTYEIAAIETHRHKVKRIFKFSASAAAAIILIGSYLIWQGVKDSKMITVTTAYGQLKELTLPDSSKLWLNAGTSVTYPEKFTTRKVIINNGDVFFAVHHEPSNPFTINTQNIRISVLGTSFEVSAYKTDQNIKVSVTSGKVGMSVTNDKGAIFLTTGKQASVQADEIAFSDIAPEDIAAWRDNRLVFDNELLGIVVQSLERKYNVQITIENKLLLNEKVTMHLNNQPLGDILSALSFSNHIKYQIINDKSVIVR